MESGPEFRNRYDAPPVECSKCGNRVIRDTGYGEFSCCICGAVYYVREGAPPVRRLSTRELHVNAGHAAFARTRPAKSA